MKQPPTLDHYREVQTMISEILRESFNPDLPGAASEPRADLDFETF